MTVPDKPIDKPIAAALVWFRRDLRADDNAALYHALRDARQVWCCFVLDREILDPLPRADRRVEFIVASLADLDAQLADLATRRGTESGLIVRHAAARDEIPKLAAALGVQAVYANHDDDPAALDRDAKVRGALADIGIALHTSKDHLIFERSEVLTGAGASYGVFTPYKNAWLKKLEPFYVKPYPVETHAAALAKPPHDHPRGVPTLASIGFGKTNLEALHFPLGTTGGRAFWTDFLHRIDDYGAQRNYPAVKGPSYLGTHLRHGTLSIRELAGEAWKRSQAGSPGAEVWLSELIWRDFYHQVLAHHPHVVTRAFKPDYDAIKWEHGKHADALFAAWCEGRTGYPLVDAAMAQINQTGYMHNRLRMVVASFLVKDLGIDWRWGERYFAVHLNDYELASNNGGWQWAASTGADPQPWFRIFNPVTQSEKFDPDGGFIRRYVPALQKLPDSAIHAPWLARPIDLAETGVTIGETYPEPIVQHDAAREKTLARYSAVRSERGGPRKAARDSG